VRSATPATDRKPGRQLDSSVGGLTVTDPQSGASAATGGCRPERVQPGSKAKSRCRDYAVEDRTTSVKARLNPPAPDAERTDHDWDHRLRRAICTACRPSNAVARAPHHDAGGISQADRSSAGWGLCDATAIFATVDCY
jgi:hypothetical protein